MTSRSARLCLATLLLSAYVPAHAQAQPVPPQVPPAPGQVPPSPGPGGAPQQVPSVPPVDNQLITLKLPDADLDTIISALEIYTGRSALRPSALPTAATYNIRINNPIPKWEAILAIETVLALNNIGITPLGKNFFKVTPLLQARVEAPTMISGSALDLPASGAVASKIFVLDFMRVQEIIPMLQASILNPNMGTPVQFVNANAALITDSISNLQRVEILLQQLDKPVTAGMKPKFYPISHTKASDLVNKLKSALQGTLTMQLGTATSYSADDRTNQIILVTDPRQHAFFDELIAKLDVRSDPNTRNEVILLNHAPAKDVTTLINSLITGQTAAAQRANAQSVRPGQGIQMQPGQPNVLPVPGANPANIILPGMTAGADSTIAGAPSNEFSALASVAFDERSNAIIVSGTVDDIRIITVLIEKLDKVLAQVRIEVVIAEVTLDDSQTSGISALGLRVDGDKVVGFSGALPGFVTSNGTVTRPNGTNNVSGPWDLAAEIAISTTPRKNNTAILSVPTITTSHAKEATFFSGETRPIISGSQQTPVGSTTGGFASASTVVQQEIGVTLTVKPLIGGDGSVFMEVTQKVEDVAGSVLVGSDEQPIIARRNTKSFITGQSGEIYVLGGIQRKKSSKVTNRLGPIPFLGDFLGRRTNQDTRTDLVFFLRPTVLTNQPELDNAKAFNRLNELPDKPRNQIRKELDPTYVDPTPPGFIRVVPR